MLVPGRESFGGLPDEDDDFFGQSQSAVPPTDLGGLPGVEAEVEETPADLADSDEADNDGAAAEPNQENALFGDASAAPAFGAAIPTL